MEQINKGELNRKKRYLKRYKATRFRIGRLYDKLNDLDSRIKSIRSPSFSGMPRGGIKITVEDLIADKLLTEERIQSLKAKSDTLKREILAEIDRLDDVRYTDVLELFFIDCLTFEEIAEELGYNERHIVRLYTKALDVLVDLDSAAER